MDLVATAKAMVRPVSAALNRASPPKAQLLVVYLLLSRFGWLVVLVQLHEEKVEVLAQLGHVDSVAVRELRLLDNLAQGEVQALALVGLRAAVRGRFHDSQLLKQVQTLRKVRFLVPDLAERLQFGAHREAAEKVKEDQASLLLYDLDRGPIRPLHCILSGVPLYVS